MRPDKNEIQRLADQLGFGLTEDEISLFTEAITGSVNVYKTVDNLASSSPYRPESRTWSRPESAPADPHNAWVTRCSVEPTGTGSLDAMAVAIKDNLPVAGLEMTCSSTLFAGYIPEIDTPLVTRILEAGGHIAGKTNMDDMASAGDGSRTAFGPVLNPHGRDHLAGGSSGGSAVAVATGAVDAAIGTDQGGSIRAPASWCGVVGHKPTFGLVPYTGGVGLEPTVDHAGPIAPDVQTAAQVLSVIAGRDPYDPRQPQSVPDVAYEPQAHQVDGSELTIGILEEGFGREGSAEAVDETVRATIDSLDTAGVSTTSVSVPQHVDGQDIHLAAIAEAAYAYFDGDATYRGQKGWSDPSLTTAFARGRRVDGQAVPAGQKLLLLLGAYSSEILTSRYHSKASNLRFALREWYDSVLAEVDVFALPTTPMTAYEYDPDEEDAAYFERAWANLSNTSPFNLTGHPALSVPVGTVDGLPVGLMLVGEHFDDGQVLGAGRVVESTVDFQVSAIAADHE